MCCSFLRYYGKDGGREGMSVCTNLMSFIIILPDLAKT